MCVTNSLYQMPDRPEIHQEFKHKGVTKQLLGEKFRQQYPQSALQLFPVLRALPGMVPAAADFYTTSAQLTLEITVSDRIASAWSLPDSFYKKPSKADASRTAVIHLFPLLLLRAVPQSVLPQDWWLMVDEQIDS